MAHPTRRSSDRNECRLDGTWHTPLDGVVTATSVDSGKLWVLKSYTIIVRAKQAAKALQVMTRSPDQDKEALQYSRLPEIARILRNLFVVEKKGVLPMDFVIQKLGHSYRESLTSLELKEHVHLLLRLLPGWLVLHNIRSTNYLKLSKNGDMSKVTNKLESLAAKKNNLTLISA
uniref:DNA replication factor Cdt1 C-terminal domain-containing protein n=1 Tax=Timema douglasi TaxID=61478 RepID=A0A7R8ZCY4_TIMDO|nr:unnamed protein product [Timema douglasi]